MDSIWVSEAYDPGSIPGRATFKSLFWLIYYEKHTKF